MVPGRHRPYRCMPQVVRNGKGKSLLFKQVPSFLQRGFEQRLLKRFLKRCPKVWQVPKVFAQNHIMSQERAKRAETGGFVQVRVIVQVVKVARPCSHRKIYRGFPTRLCHRYAVRRALSSSTTTSDLQKSRHLQKNRATERHNRGTKRKLKSHQAQKKALRAFFGSGGATSIFALAPIVPLRDATFFANDSTSASH